MSHPEKTKQEFLKAYDAYADDIYRHCFFKVLNEARAEDFTQETFTKVWVYLSEGNDVQNIRAFLYKVATNLIIDESRKKREDSIEALMEEEKMEEPSYAGHIEIETRAAISLAMDVIRTLPEEDQNLITMRYIDDLDPKDIALITGMTPNNVSVRIHRALESLRKDTENPNPKI